MPRPRKVPVRPAVRPEVRPEVERPPVRASVEDHRARAEARAREILGHADGLDDAVDKFYINPDLIPEGWDYQWRKHTVFGQEDPAYAVALSRTGWEAVPASRHPEMMPMGWKGSIVRDGLMLMERPMAITNTERAKELRRAQGQVRAKEEQLGAAPAGQFERDHPQARPNIKKHYEPVLIPED